MSEPKNISRRAFARDSIFLAAGVAMTSAALAQEAQVPPSPAKPAPAAQSEPELSAPARHEVELKYQWIVDRYGARLSEAERQDVRHLLEQTQHSLEALRAYPLENADEPATVFHPLTPDKVNHAR